ncbi:MAG: two-component system response regulator [Pedobacter sp.]|nr:two-component system response regulator [Pedobacter sp.]
MKLINCILVDDEEFARSSLFFLLQNHCKNVHVSGIAKSVPEAKILLKKEKIDLIFLDIAMPGQNGFELIGAAQENNAHVVFTTAYDQYALKAIKANALDYLLKPIDIDELKETVDKAVKYIAMNTNEASRNERLTSLKQDLDNKQVQKLSLPNSQGYALVDIKNIIHVEADSNYSIFHLANNEQVTVSKVLKEYEELLPEQQFVRVHKSSIVNLNYVKEYNSKNGLEVILNNGKKIAVSRRRSSEFLEKIKAFTQLKSDT